MAEIVIRESSGEQAVVQFLSSRHLNASAIQVCTTAFPCREALVTGDLMYHAEKGFGAVDQGDADAVAWHTVYEVGGTVQRVDDPVQSLTALATAFLGDEARFRNNFSQGLHQAVLCGVVHMGHQVVRALVAYAGFGELSGFITDEFGNFDADRFDLFSVFLEVHSVGHWFVGEAPFQ